MLANLAAPTMSATAGLNRHDTSRQLVEKLQNLSSPQLFSQDRSTSTVGAMNLKHILRQIEPYRESLRHDRPALWIIADPPWHVDAVGERLQHQSLALVKVLRRVVWRVYLNISRPSHRSASERDNTHVGHEVDWR